jgi:hypothetical protein
VCVYIDECDEWIWIYYNLECCKLTEIVTCMASVFLVCCFFNVF